MTVATRFAPSPTGSLHVGSARIALFNWLYARRHDGEFRLRLEDTDRKRSTEEAVSSIVGGLAWLGLDWDGDILYQSERLERHAGIARWLLDEDKAYRCYCTPEELAEMREVARERGRPVLYDGRWRDRDPFEAPADVPPTVRIKSPLSGETVIDDRVQGSVAWANEQLDDMVLLRSDGTPTYMLSAVVDDHDMGVTHVIRGDDHLNNAARQKILFEALDWKVPEFAHVPLIHGADGAKLSKRHGTVGVEAYRDEYLPEAMRNYLARLGWSHGDDELFTTEQAIEWFDLDRVGRGAARFDHVKLRSVNAYYIRRSSDADLVKTIRNRLGRDLEDHDLERLTAAMPELKPRVRSLSELVENTSFIVSHRPIEIEEKAARILTPDVRSMLRDLADVLEALGDWSLPEIEATIREYAAGNGIKLGAVAQPLRASLTGKTASPGIFEVLNILGREESLGRIGDAARP